jgi:predicted dinucleotide-binding enzyme
VGYGKLQAEHHRDGERIAIPLAADDKHALEVAMRLVRDAGFEPVVVGGLATAKTFDVGTPVFGKALTTDELRKALNIAQ